MASHFQVVFLVCFTGGLLFEGAMSTCKKAHVPVPGCPTGWTVFGSRCFMYQANSTDVADAELACISLGGNLASIHSAEEHKFVRDLIRENNGSDTRTWIGGHDSIKESTWMWTDGSQFDYTDWNEGEPNNLDQPTQRPEHCLETNFAGAYWNDLSCSLERPSVCAKRLPLTV